MTEPNKQSKIRRRQFMGKSAAAGLGALTAPAIFSSAGRVLGANDRMTMAILGSGGRGRNVKSKMIRKCGVDFATVCDVYEPNVQKGLRVAGGDARGVRDYREALDQKNIDAVLIASPDHQHGPMLKAAVAADKDAYCEKPMSHSIEEGLEMIKAVRQTDRIVQIGMQRRSSPTIHKAKELLKECGDVYLVKAYWNWQWAQPLDKKPLDGKLDWQGFLGPAPNVPFSPERYRMWRNFWDYSGGNCTDQGTHLMDVVQWFMGKGTPRAASCHGQVYAMIGAETPDVFSATYDYDGYMATWTLDYVNAMDNGWNIQFLGSKATLWLDNQGVRLYELEASGTTYSRTKKANVVKEIQEPLGDLEHIRNFVECCRTREQPNAPVEVGHSAVCAPHLANVAFHHKTQARLNKHATRVRV